MIKVIVPTLLFVFSSLASGASGSLSFLGVNDKEIHASVFATEGSQPVIIAIGLGESESTYSELISDLAEMGLGPIYIMDHRYQGLSGPLVSQRAYVEKFNHYVKDFTKFANTEVHRDLKQRGLSEKPLLLGHSMGGQIAGQYLLDNQSKIRAAAFIAPMFGIKYPEALNPETNSWVRALLNTMAAMTPKGTPPLTPDEIPAFEGNTNTSSEERFWAKMNPLMENNSHLVNVSNRWVLESLIATQFFRKHFSSIHIPTLVVGAEMDELVNNQDLKNFACDAQNCDYMEISGSKHGIHIEDDIYRNQLLTLLRHFLTTPQKPQFLRSLHCSSLF